MTHKRILKCLKAQHLHGCILK